MYQVELFFERFVALKKAVFSVQQGDNLFAAGVFGDSFGSFRDSVFCQFSWKQETNRCLNFTRSHGQPLVLDAKSWCLTSQSFEDVVDERVHDAHRFAWDSNIRVNLLQNFVDVHGVRFASFASSFGCFGASFTSSFLYCFSTFLWACSSWCRFLWTSSHCLVLIFLSQDYQLVWNCRSWCWGQSSSRTYIKKVDKQTFENFNIRKINKQSKVEK